MILNTARITVQPEKRIEFFQTITRLLEPIKHARGCLGFRFYVDTMDENSSLLVGEWESESDLEKHLRSNDFAVLRGAIAVLSTRRDEFRALIYAGGRETDPARTGMTAIVSGRL
jgi:quinol monooxygenase YgiN